MSDNSSYGEYGGAIFYIVALLLGIGLIIICLIHDEPTYDPGIGPEYPGQKPSYITIQDGPRAGQAK